MQIYLPIAEVSVNIFLLLGIGGGVGILSGMFGVGGGFLMTPLLFFIGIPPAIADAIFDPFVSGRENGTGLGLALVAGIIEDHGGWIGVESRPGQTRFRIALPIAGKEGA